MASAELGNLQPGEKVKVKFDKFLALVVNHTSDQIFEKYMGEDIIMSADLLADLAGTQEEKKTKKTPLIFVLGIVLGILVTWFILRG